MKKLFVLLVATLMSLNIWADAVEVDGLWYILNNDNTATVSKYEGDKYSGDIEIPENINYDGKNYVVTEIGIYAFRDCSELASIVIPPTILLLDQGCFLKCDKITSIMIPKSVKDIVQNPFSGCIGLSSITVDPNNPYFNSDGNCNAIVETATNTLVVGCANSTVNDNIKHIGDCAFERMTTLTSITLPEGLQTIKQFAFGHCENLPSIHIPNSVTEIERDAFFGCHGFTSFTFPDKIKTVSESVLQYSKNLETVTIPEGVTKIEMQAFAADSSLVSAIIPSSVTYIGQYTFADCTSLTEVNIPKSITTIENYTFCNCKSLAILSIPEGVKTIKDCAFANCIFETINLPSTVETIGNLAFRNKTASSVTVNAKNPPIIDEEAFPYRADQILFVPVGRKGVYEAADYWKEFRKILEIGETPDDPEPSTPEEPEPTTPEFGGKHIKTITWTDGKDTEVGELRYDEAGRIKEYLIDGKTRDKYAYSDNSITITESGDTYEYTISNGRVVSGKTALDGGEIDIDRTFSYNLDGQLASIVNKEKERGYSEVYTIIESWEWRDGNLSMWTLLDDEDTETSLFTYNNITAEPMMRALFGFGQERHLDDFYELLAIYPYMGKLPNNLFERIKHRDAEDREWEYNYTYDQNANGDIAKVTISFKDKTYVYTFEWEGSDDPSAIKDTVVSPLEQHVYYNLNGQKVITPVKGIYIKNGKKVIVK